MLKLEDILCQAGLGKVFYHKNCEDLMFHVYYNKFTEDYVLIVHDEGETIHVPVVSALLDGFYTKD